MNRRAALSAFLALLATRLDAQPRPPGSVYRMGVLGGSSPTSPEAGHIWDAFLRELGYVEGRNLVIEGRYCCDRLDRLPGLAAELVELKVDLIVAASPPAPEAARRATSTIPIVMANHSDPVASRIVASLARPGGSVTGLSLLAQDLRVKQLQLLEEILPALDRVAFLRNPTVPQDLDELHSAARSLELRTQIVDARAPGELAATHRLPTVYLLKEFVYAGGLLSYGVDLRDNFRRAAGYVDRILRGARSADLPVEQPTKFELVINTRTAKALGLAIPGPVLARADQLVE